MKKNDFNYLKRKAFTLAEILIVLGMLGVIASLTIPNVVNSVDNQKYIAMLKSSYVNLESAYKMATAEYNGNIFYNLAATSNAVLSSGVAGRLFDQLNVDYNCGNTTSNLCFINQKPLYIGGTENTIVPASNTDYFKVTLGDASSVAVVCNYQAMTCNVTVDTDGPNKGYNTYGIDLFRFELTPESFSYANPTAMNQNNADGCVSGNEMQCAAWVMRFDNMDYLNCKNSLSVSSNKTSCN